MLWGCFNASGTGDIECIKGMMKSEEYRGILELNVLQSVRKLGLRLESRILQQDSDPKQTSSSKKNGWKGKDFSNRPAMSPGQNPIEKL